MKKILGISAFYHDSAAALLIDGKIISAAQEGEKSEPQRHRGRREKGSVLFVPLW
ncbi:MAG: carbamoyltransferase N-terminal domain-containing protein [Bacteroidales bacterium]|jgi:carbamoyltransferase